jgi:hypothetical protein
MVDATQNSISSVIRTFADGSLFFICPLLHKTVWITRIRSLVLRIAPANEKLRALIPAQNDIPTWRERLGHRLLASDRRTHQATFLIFRGRARRPPLEPGTCAPGVRLAYGAALYGDVSLMSTAIKGPNLESTSCPDFVTRLPSVYLRCRLFGETM